MKKWFDIYFFRDLTKLAFFGAALIGIILLFFISPALSTPTALSIVVTLLFSPWVAGLERRGIGRSVAIIALFLIIGGSLIGLGIWLSNSGYLQWDTFREKAPRVFDSTVARLQDFENTFKAKYPFLKSINPTKGLITWGKQTGEWFIKNGASIVGEGLTWIFIVPLLSFVLLSQGPDIRRRFFQLIPNRYFESMFLVTHKIASALADYIRAKMLEAFIVGTITWLGLQIVGAPYPIVFGLIAGITNILPYIGPIIGSVPGLLVVLVDPSQSHLLWPILGVYTVANVIDSVFIFPVVVAKLVNLNPLILIAVVAVGQEYYGLIGMLISIPIATAVKVILQEIYDLIYESEPSVLGNHLDNHGPKIVRSAPNLRV